MSIDITSPISDRVSQQSLRDVAQRTYVEVGLLISCQSGDVHDFLPSKSFPKSPNWDLLGSMTQGGYEMTDGGARCWSMGGPKGDLTTGRPIRGFVS